MLVTQAGEPVLSAAGKPISVPPGEVSVGANGVLSVAAGRWPRWASFTFPGNGAAHARGRQPLRRSGWAYSRLQSSDAAIHQGALESANQDAVQGTLDLIMMQRQAEMMQKALTVFHTEFNKFATEDLPRV